ncbi:MAG: cob(I)yrinic acid a,c-diamide adenosyltransferase [Candidatus Thorarchaeota archaeon]|nr:cob(I)yrinic acid a,c-diamide adenosyltransferase [Candidatus Thorarchaeota archaeon]
MSKRIYTRKGDKGTTGLFSGERIAKDDQRVEAYGTVDELIASLGVAKVHSSDRIAVYVHEIQQILFYVAAELATNREAIEDKEMLAAIKTVSADDVIRLENIADELVEELPLLKNFVIPGGTKGAAFLHVSRTVCRRAERRIITYSGDKQINPEIVRFVNRLSDLLFVMSRYENLEVGDGDNVISREGTRIQTK